MALMDTRVHRSFGIAALAVALAACATMPRDDDYRLALSDHEVCAERGFSFPSNRYDGCRHQLAERRHQRDWQNLQMTRMPQLDQGPDYRHSDAYRPLSREAFRCVEREASDGTVWIDCSTTR
jgi:hypothetical protein